MKDWITVVAMSLAFLAIGFALYWAIDQWTAVTLDKTTSAIAISVFASSPLAAFAGLVVNKKMKERQ
ncbi:hypothetical protein C1Y63_02305 [Corynebacterium sp. 13CS0277]|uniref:hypothetical protein n=1 Tax=Corynebacterium sp. 13CS0277 TaxID=2071994 RepID=UPI000D023B23|nr:hypothetical protein [Corynebacterium sp. 13CS0277]PRQ12164.1 hypothetical protein C1Y63_02305 [Corynebacterium sp. 13CS0277]